MVRGPDTDVQRDLMMLESIFAHLTAVERR